ncbi:PAS domain S-box-containing protein/diguanylate cyclase (GGDEF) domain-containing protein [Dethiosulfatibacter aminovorans DSM 17477]|uniref:PAS domain S-box-containing protein/diguanylate cyclase (GGDEF) domain-containing protein n=1 Tax=Dethiosulfatibacter aminovorans DSM 17477 TaxID=1121476 RepID=A0A1M6FQR3_9FIRM|nr:sensor domain-containing diguanylate cyclase [Dethiosulfatibacter aminovorans]SHJ00031.1 PAS domain S-box-containing protein/diguanylate cyclase (GGDEF) domain-containing protein [Dethiosulfatibacter aminovorans DSM 17477]
MRKILTIEKTLFICALALLVSIIWADQYTNAVDLMIKFLGLNETTGKSIIFSGVILIILAIYMIGIRAYKKMAFEKDDILMNFFDNTDDAVIIVKNNMICNCNSKAVEVLKAGSFNKLKGKNIHEFITTNLVSFDTKNKRETKYTHVSTMDGEYMEALVTISNFMSDKKKLTQIKVHDSKLISSINNISNDEENLLTFISRETDIGFFNWDINADYFTYNKVFQNLTSSSFVKPKDFINSSKIHPEDSVLLKNEMEYCRLNEGYGFTLKFRLEEKENKWKWHTLKAKHSNTEGMNHIMGVLTDLSDHSSSEYKYNLLENHANIGSMKFDRQNKLYQNFSLEALKILNMENSMLIMEETNFLHLFKPNDNDLDSKERIYTLSSDNKKVKLLHIIDSKDNNRYDNCLIFDITDSWQKEDELYKTSFAVNKSLEEIYFTDTEGYVIYANDAARKSFGISIHDYNSKKIMDFNTNIDYRWWNQILLPNINRNKIFSFESFIKSSRNSSIKYIEIQNNLISNREHQYICSFVRDITSRKKFEKELKHVATHDQLSKIYNRNGIYENMQEMFTKEQFAVVMIDLDDFKPVNDTYGHDAGDMVIATLAKRLSTSGPQGSLAGRLSGDEFIMIIPDYGNLDALEEIIKEIYHSITRKYIISQGVCKVDASIGISLYPEDGSSRQELFRKADEAMYSVKTSGKSGYAMYSNML